MADTPGTATTRTLHNGPRTRRSGFTLLEVLAAVAVLGFSVAMLARGAIQGMGYEGEASRRLAASLIADQLLFEVESNLALGNPPEPGRQEPEADDDFVRVVEVAPLDLASLGLGDLFVAADTPAGTERTAALANAPKVFSIRVEVGWTEGLAEQRVTRTTFATDTSAAVAALQAAGAGGGTEGTGAQSSSGADDTSGAPGPSGSQPSTRSQSSSRFRRGSRSQPPAADTGEDD